MDRFEEILRELHHELIETRNLSIRTENATKSLSGEIKQIARRQEAYERRYVVNSVAAYVLYTVITFAGLFLFFRASIGAAQLDHDLANQERAALERRVAELDAELERRRESERQAYDFYELLETGSRDEVVERFPTIQGRLIDRATIELFRREIERIRGDLAQDAYRMGLQAFDDEQWQDARDAFARSVAYVERTAYTPSLQFHLAESLFRLADYPGALSYYVPALDSGTLNRNDGIVALFHRAEALERSSRDREALDVYRTFARRYSEHYWTPTAEVRIGNLQRRLDSDEGGAE